MTATTSLPVRLRAMLTNEKYTDCCFVIDGTSTCIYGHKIILAAASPVFEAMFYGPFATQQQQQQNNTHSGGLQDSPVSIVDVSAKIFRVMLEFIYTDELNWSALTNYDLLELYYCVDKYLMRKDDILQRIRNTLNCNNLFLFYDFAIRFKVPLLLTDCRLAIKELLDKKPNLFFKKVLQVNCDRVIRDNEEEEGSFSEENGPTMKRKPPTPIEFIQDIVFGASEEEQIIGQYHQVSKECLNDLIVLNYDDANGLFNENLLLFVLKWTKIQWKLDSKGRENLPLKKLSLLNFYSSFVCHKRTVPLVENLMSFLDNHYYLNNVQSVSGWHLMQRADIKASRPLTVSSSCDPTTFVTKFQVNHRIITIKSFIINSRLNNAILSRFMRSTPSRQILYKENVSIEIWSSDTATQRDPITIHRQKFNALEAEFNSQCELFLNKCLYFYPDQVYTLHFQWPTDSALAIEYPRKIYERCPRMSMTDKKLSIVFIDDVQAAAAAARSTEMGKESDLISGGILCGLQFMFVS